MKPVMMAPQAAPDVVFEARSLPQALEIRILSYLRRGLQQAGGKLPLFDLDGQEFEASVIRLCITRGWAEPWFSNPLKPDWLVCRLTDAGRAVVERHLSMSPCAPDRAA
jgi:hypothetical protein